ncbi:hypothetical protein TKK_0008718 [Trichogramma kaykai]
MNTDLDSDSMETDDNNKSKKNRHENKRKFTNDGKDNYSADNKRHNGDTHSSSSDNITPTTGNPSTQEFYKSNAKGPYSVWALVAPSRTRPNSVNKTQENYPVLMNNNRTMGKTAQPNTSFRPTYINSKNSTPTYKDIVADSASGTSITPASANTSTSDSTSTLTPASPPKTFKTKINNNCTYQAKENNSQSKNSLDLKFQDPTMYLFPQDKNKGLISTTNKLQERLSQGRNDNK